MPTWLAVFFGLAVLIALWQTLRIQPISRFLHRALGDKAFVETKYSSTGRGASYYPRVEVSLAPSRAPLEFDLIVVRTWGFFNALKWVTAIVFPVGAGFIALLVRLRNWTCEVRRLGPYTVHLLGPIELGDTFDNMDAKLRRQLEALFGQGFRSLSSDGALVTAQVTFVHAPWRLDERCLRALPDMLRGLAAAFPAAESQRGQQA
jgi:hypothetical protein